MKSRRFRKVSAPVVERLFDDQDVLSQARAVLLYQMHHLDGKGISANSPTTVHLVLTDTSALMLAIARQAALVCHFPNFREDADDQECHFRTRITILCRKAVSAEKTAEQLLGRLRADDCLSHLFDACAWRVQYADNTICNDDANVLNYTDIEFEIVGINGSDVNEYVATHYAQDNGHELVSIVAPQGDLTDEVLCQLRTTCHQVFCLDVTEPPILSRYETDIERRARWINMVYTASSYTSPIAPWDMDDVRSYELPLRTLIYHIGERATQQQWDRLPRDLKLSNVYCYDCFSYRLRSVGLDVHSPISKQRKQLREHLVDLSRVEHIRWVTEKLLMGYRAYTMEEFYEDMMRYEEQQKHYRNQMKREKAHIDICSNRTLRRIDPDAMRYDSFLMLAIPEILDKSMSSRWQIFLHSLKF